MKGTKEVYEGIIDWFRVFGVAVTKHIAERSSVKPSVRCDICVCFRNMLTELKGLLHSNIIDS